MRKIFQLFLLALMLTPAISLAQFTVDDTGLKETGEPVYGRAQTQEDIGTYVAEKIITPIFSTLGLVFLVLFIYGGILWMTDSGNAQNVGKAKKILASTLIGLIIILLSYGISQFIFSAIK